MPWHIGLRCVFLALLGWILYAQTLHYPFVFDDIQNIRDNIAIRLESFTSPEMTRFFRASHAVHRPVVNFSFAMNYYLHGYDVIGYHVVNILIHLTVALLLYRFVYVTLGLPGARAGAAAPAGIAFATALLWLVHPLQTQSVTYIVQRMNSMAVLFYLLALVLYAQARLAQTKQTRILLFAGCLLASLLAFGAKEITVTLPLFILLYEFYFFQDLSCAWLRRMSWWGLSFLGLFLVMAWLYLGANPWESILLGYDLRDFTLFERVLTEWRVIFFYLRLLCWPHPSQLTLDHDFPLSHSLFDPPSTVLALGGIVGLLALAIARARQNRILSFSILWFLGNLAIESSIIGLEIVFEHRLYLPSMLFFWLFVTTIFILLQRPYLRVGCLGAVALLCMVWTYERNQVWRDEVTLWQDCIAKAPQKSRPYMNLFNALKNQGKFDEALPYYETALRLSATSPEMHLRLGIHFMAQQMFAAAIEHFTAGITLKPDSASLRTRLGVALAEQGKFDEAIEQYTTVLRSYPTFAEAYYHLGVALAYQGKFTEAWRGYNTALHYRPAYAMAYYSKGELLTRVGKRPAAIQQYSEALHLDPTIPEVHASLGRVLESQGDLERAKYHYDEAIHLAEEISTLSHSENVTMLLRLFRVYAVAGRKFEAIITAQQVLKRAQAIGATTLASEVEQWLENAYKHP